MSFASYMQANTTHEPDPRFENIPDDAIVGNDYIMNQSNQNANSNNYNNGNNNNDGKKFRLRISQRLHHSAVLAFISFIILLISFASPYWLSSYHFTDSAFKRLGLWDFCFQDYRHPSYQYDMKFNGCHWIYSPVYTNIRDWLQPPWFIFVQAVTTIALCISALGLLTVSVIFMHFLIQYQLIILCITLVCHMFTTLLLSFAVITFYAKAFDRSWIMYPDYNHVDWAFFFALISAAGNGYTSYLYYKEVTELKERMLKMKRLIVAISNGRSTQGGEIDSLDAVYASRSVNSYNQSMKNDNQGVRSQPSTYKDPALVYPHFTQV